MVRRKDAKTPIFRGCFPQDLDLLAQYTLCVHKAIHLVLADAHYKSGTVKRV